MSKIQDKVQEIEKAISQSNSPINNAEGNNKISPNKIFKLNPNNLNVQKNEKIAVLHVSMCKNLQDAQTVIRLKF